jgi:hypothetical protein
VDLHSHLGVLSVPLTAGSASLLHFPLKTIDEWLAADELNSKHGPVAPWLRTIDGFNTHDDGFELAMAGGVTSAQVLSGGSNAIGNYSESIWL